MKYCLKKNIRLRFIFVLSPCCQQANFRLSEFKTITVVIGDYQSYTVSGILQDKVESFASIGRRIRNHGPKINVRYIGSSRRNL